ncbi:MAG: 1,6-anhydro-N-acetylmuramyl-L-alanine amidase AmpD [Legionellales bacterium]|nr:1,6-anhydro-N-acetylmuramyl-L-alanine amidase AmpD [Legionellales bacterium]
MQIKNGVVSNTEQIFSPNYDDRPTGTQIDLLVVHCISLPPKEWGTQWIEALFQNRLNPNQHPYFAEIYQLKVSAHLLIERSGLIKQFVNLESRAWHAGQSIFDNKTACNDFSIGIELNGFPTKPYTAAQYKSLSQLSRAIMEHYPGITPDRITGHEFIAPGRKPDPGPSFDWDRFHKELEVI